MSSDPEPCETVRQHLFEYVDGAFTAQHAVRTLVADHVQRCPRCARLERQVRHLRTLLLALGDRLRVHDRASPELRRRVLDLLQRRDLPT